MINNTKELLAELDNLFIKEEYVRKKSTYYKDTKETILVFTIEKSPYGGKYHHMMGCFVKDIMDVQEQFPKYYQAHLKYSIEYFVDRSLFNTVFDFRDSSISSKEREEKIFFFISHYAIPFLNAISTVSGLSKYIKENKKLMNRTKGILLDFLNIPYEE